MKWYPGRDGDERLWLDRDEIESIMEAELTKANLFPLSENPVVHLERFIEGHLRVRMDQYAPLDPSVLGLTEFYVDASPKVFINRDLTGAVDDDETPPGIIGRWRATLAHEASHVVLHRVLFELQGNQPGLFSSEAHLKLPSQRLMRCLKQNVLFRLSGGDWREVQANLGMAALLMPRSLFVQKADEVSRQRRFQCKGLLRESFEAEQLTAQMATLFAVSRQAASIRLETLRFFVAAGQQQLL